MIQLLRLLRPQQWVKNVFVLLPVFFGQQLLSLSPTGRALGMMLLFSLAASGTYCLNDLCDAAADRLHPQKRLRPVASGAVSKGAALLLMFLCWIVALMAALFVYGTTEAGILLFYILLNVCYSFWLKHVAVLDITVIAAGFVLRVMAGGAAAHIAVSHWLVLMTFLLTLFIALGKRRDDIVLYRTTGQKPRRNIGRYSLRWVNVATLLLATLIVVGYVLYTLSDEVNARLQYPYLYTTALFVAAALLRYLYVTSRPSALTYSPTKILLHDCPLQLCLLAWLIHFSLILYS